MDVIKKRRLIAAVAAVYGYLRSQEEQQLAMAAADQRMPAPPVVAVSLWPASGRQATMEMRRLLQLRMIR
ncbi:MAG: hypothetical protein PVG64_03265 [Syntrophobacterales bacterium]|jgi:hypothetical protein